KFDEFSTALCAAFGRVRVVEADQQGGGSRACVLTVDVQRLGQFVGLPHRGGVPTFVGKTEVAPPLVRRAVELVQHALVHTEEAVESPTVDRVLGGETGI